MLVWLLGAGWTQIVKETVWLLGAGWTQIVKETSTLLRGVPGEVEWGRDPEVHTSPRSQT